MACGLAEKERVRDLLGKVVSREIADQLVGKPVNLEGEERVATIMYVDIQGFTGFCEGKSPREALKVLNSYLSKVASQVESHNGVVDKFLGDGVMALFGAPVRHQDDVKNALETALAIKRQWQQTTAGLPFEIEVGSLQPCIGINTGLVVAGNLGSSTRLNYSVIGDAVNLAARLESLTRYYGVTCVVSAETAESGKGFIYRELDLVRVYGRRDPVRIFELVGEEHSVDSALRDDIARFQDFLSCYRSRQWDAAEAILMSLTRTPCSHNLYALYRDRIAFFRANPPDPDWRGIFVFDKKSPT